MGIDDPLLPAAAHLAGPYADDVLRPAVAWAGGSLRSLRCTRLHYRPGHDLVAQFRAEVEWRDGRVRNETILAATTATGPPDGSVAVTAETADGELAVGVWRWPFDPALPALEAALRTTNELLVDAGLVDRHAVAQIDVIAYRPMERAVLRVRTGGTTRYVKVVAPRDAPQIVRRHQLLRSVGLPVPHVVGDDQERGVIVLAELAGPTLRDLIKRDDPRWIDPGTLRDLVGLLGDVDAGDLSALRSRIVDGPFHTSMLSAVLPRERQRLERLGEWLRGEGEVARQRPRRFVHGDLHENQLVVEHGRIVGLLDIDEAGLGDPVDDVAVPAAHLHYRSLSAPNAARIGAFADAFVASCTADHAPRDVAAGTVAVLAGLATGPFRAQADAWQAQVSAVLDLVDRIRPPD